MSRTYKGKIALDIRDSSMRRIADRGVRYSNVHTTALVVDVSGDQYLDHEKQVMAWISRD